MNTQGGVTMRVHLAKRALVRIPLMAIAIAVAACTDQSPTEPSGIISKSPTARGVILTPGLSVYTDRASWEAAVATAGATVVNMNFAGLTQGRVTQLVTDYGDFAIEVDDVAASSFSNPGIEIFADASCSLGVGDCDVFTFNMLDPTSAFDGPKVNILRLDSNIVAFGGDYIQVGITVPPPGSATGTVTLQIGTESFPLNSYVDAGGNGFIGFVTTASDAVTFTFVKSASLQNDIFQIYNPAYALEPAVDPGNPEEAIGDLRTVIAGLGLAAGTATSLDVKLRAALSALDADNEAVACAALSDLIDFANAQRGKKISGAQADMIVSAAGDIRADIGC
jgi:hypothetical protein